MRRYAGMVFNVCFRITKDKHEAEDAVQAVFLTLALQAKRGTEIKALGPWLQQVAKRLALDSRRSKKRRKTREERHHSETTIRREQILGDALPSADMDELKTILHEELQKLPAKYRLPLILHYFGGLSRDEMAAELNCKASTLGVRIFRGREMLAGRLSGRGINISSAALAMLLGYAIKRAVSDSLIASTSHAATAMMAGYDGSHLASANVIGLTRRATNAMAIGKVKMAALSLLIAGTSLGAGAKALQILPAGTLQRMISNQIRRLVQPILQPLNQPMLSQAPATPPTPQTSTDTGSAYTYTITGTPVQSAPTLPMLTRATPTAVETTPSVVAGNNTTNAQTASSSWTSTYLPPTPSTSVANTNSATSASPSLADSASGGSSSSTGGAAGGSTGGLPAFAIATPAASRSFGSTSAAAQFADVVIGTNSLTIASASRATGAGSSTTVKSNTSSLTQSPTATILIPSSTGTITETNTGELRGWGTPTASGSLVMAGVTVADGDGVDRTLNFTPFSSIQTTVPASGAQTASAANTIAITPPISSSSTLTKSVTPSSSVVLTASTGTPAGTTVGSTSTTNSAGFDAVTVTGTATTGSSSTTTDSNSAASISATSTGASGTTSTSTITTPPPGTIAPPLNGWYAVDHGRLCMNLEPSTTSPNVLTWGDSANGSLSLINSVRLSISGDSSTVLPSQLSLMSPDRDDAMNLSQITGVTIGLWKVDSATGSIADANLEVHYDTLLANALGADPDSIDLWALNAQTDQWTAVAPDTLVLDTTDDLVFGSAQDFSAFAVSAIPAPGADIDLIRAHQLAMINDSPVMAHHDDAMPGGIAAMPSVADPSGPSGVSSIPEPVGLPLLALGLGLLGRRRRK